MVPSPRSNVLVLAESAAAALPATVYELLGLARQLAGASGGDTCVVLSGDTGPELGRVLAARGADRVLHAPCADLAALSAEARLLSLEAACERTAPLIVLFAHDLLGAELAPRLAFRVDGAAATGCVDVSLQAGLVRCTRPCYGGLAREVNEYSRSPLIASVRPGVYEPTTITGAREPAWESLPAIVPSARVRLVGRTADSTAGMRLEDARVVVAGGRGLQGPQGFAVLQALAAALDGAVGASRVPCDLGWCPHSWQIGLTGKTVTPELYVAVGISGAGHHMAGCGNAKTIVAINADPEAPIFQDARFGVVGDYREIIPALTAAVHALKQTS